MRNKLFYVFFFAILQVFFGCSKSSEFNPELTQELVISSFSVQTPSDWKWKQDQGIDTFIGRIFNDQHTIYFDQGYLSFENFNRVEESDRTISFQ